MESETTFSNKVATFTPRVHFVIHLQFKLLANLGQSATVSSLTRRRSPATKPHALALLYKDSTSTLVFYSHRWGQRVLRKSLYITLLAYDPRLQWAPVRLVNQSKKYITSFPPPCMYSNFFPSKSTVTLSHLDNPKVSNLDHLLHLTLGHTSHLYI